MHCHIWELSTGNMESLINSVEMTMKLIRTSGFTGSIWLMLSPHFQRHELGASPGEKESTMPAPACSVLPEKWGQHICHGRAGGPCPKGLTELSSRLINPGQCGREQETQKGVAPWSLSATKSSLIHNLQDTQPVPETPERGK